MSNPPMAWTRPDDLQPFMQAYALLMQRNVQLLARFSTSPEMISLWMAYGHELFNQALRSAAAGNTDEDQEKWTEQVQRIMVKVGRSRAFAKLLQGLVKSQMQFALDLAQSGVVALCREPARVMEQVQAAAFAGVPVPVHLLQQSPPQRGRRKAH